MYLTEIKTLNEGVMKVKLDDLYIFQDNSDADKRWINKLVKDIEAKKALEPLLILKITPRFKKDLKQLKEKLSKMPTHKKYADEIDDDIFTSSKKWILLDGNHRYLAALQAGKKSLTAEEDKMDAEEYVDYINESDF